jgi:calcineurin-like phosphoesterase family protein
MKKINQKQVSQEPLELVERYCAFLLSTYKTESGNFAQYAPNTNFVETLRQLRRNNPRPRIDVAACIMGSQKGFTGTVWFLSDLHLGHVALLKLRGYPNAKSTSEIDGRMLSNCLAIIKKDDLLVIGGDVCMGGFHGLAAANDWLRQIPAKKILVLGNHDVSNDGQILRLAVDEIVPLLDLEFEGLRIVVTHYPVPMELLDSAPGAVNVHGHIHSHDLPTEMLGSGDDGRHINMCVEPLNFMPVTLQWLLASPTGVADEFDSTKMDSIAALRKLRGTIPSDFNFDRDEANER